SFLALRMHRACLLRDRLVERGERRLLKRLSGRSGQWTGRRGARRGAKGHPRVRRRSTQAPVTDAAQVTNAPHAMSMTVSCQVQTRSTAVAGEIVGAISAQSEKYAIRRRGPNAA